MDTLLRRLRDKRNETTSGVAAQITKGGTKVSQSHYSRVETGDSDASPELANALASYFGVPLDMLFSPSRYAVEELAEKAA